MQRYRVVILIVLFGVVPVVIAFFAALSFLQDEAAPPEVPVSAVVEAPAPPPEPAPETRTVLAAARNLAVGTLLGEEDLERIEIDLAVVREDHIPVGEGTDERVLRGFAMREGLAAGQAVAWPSVVGPNQRGFLAAVLRPGMRAVTIRVGPATSHAGLVDPGDRVDVILSAEVQISEQERAVLAGTIVEDVRVLAVDRVIENVAEASGSGPVLERSEIVTATLEVTPEQGGRLVLGGHEGVLSIAVRSLADGSSGMSASAIELRDLLLPETGDPAHALEERLRAEIELLEERLREEEEDRLRLEEEGRVRLENELALMEQRMRAEMEAAAAPEDEVKTVRIFRGSEPAQEIEFSMGGTLEGEERPALLPQPGPESN